jgi:release factor glutamine methyltransferase
VSSDVIDPRPETEFLIKAALEKPFERLLDLGTGSGVILLTLLCERPKAIGLGCDISPKALKVARQNADVFGIGSSRVKLLQSNWFANITGKFDLIVANPPYISSDEMRALDPDVLAFEPHIALSPGGDGLACYRIIARDCASFLRPLGRLIVEIGSKQGPDVCAIFARHGLLNPLILKDFDGRDRILQANAAL